MAKSIDAALIREYEAHKDCSKEEMEEYLKSLPPSERERFQAYAAKMEREKRKKEQKKKEEAQNRIGCLLTVVIFAGLIGLMAYFQDNESAEESKPAPQAKQETRDSGKQSTAAAVESEDDEEKDKDAKIKALKLAAFNKWTEETDRQAEIVDSNWKLLWEGALAAMSKGEAERKEASQNIESFEKKLNEIKLVFAKMEASKHLTKPEQEKLKEANAEYVVWIEEREKACGEMKEIVDKNLTPEKLQEIEAAIKKSDEKREKIKSRIIEFQKGMGLIPE